MVKPVLNKPYTPWHATDVRQAFELERQRIAREASDRLNQSFGAALAVALVDAARASSVSAPGAKP
ncbi:hypothetical protein [Mitsuaria sp. GD03876]|uniref:hypothetical protein n=1 Tax=Mitsuaria sp. GD03876 TaxID=2975399 RepID=UPI0024493690|nr:hypothetical protein [Mitsuaria sp. GD03876]MDH0866474.1 hypothetical protein [Mitsuaria sp. GD03876]